MQFSSNYRSFVCRGVDLNVGCSSGRHLAEMAQTTLKVLDLGKIQDVNHSRKSLSLLSFQSKKQQISR